MTIETAFKVLEFGFQWGCDASEEVTNDNCTKDHILEAYRAEMCLLGKLSIFILLNVKIHSNKFQNLVV